jgi:hypothetical protein
MSRSNDKLEFISVSQGDDDAMNSQHRSVVEDESAVDSVIGNTFLKYSKVVTASRALILL